MEYYAISLYQKFSCLAGDCPSTCCAGWSIFVSSEDYRRFSNLSPDWLRLDILSNIQRKENGYYFKNNMDGRCAMLEEDGLCRIQKNAAEETLCNTCRKYPRLFYMIQGALYLSMAASCPVVSEYLVNDTVTWICSDENGRGEQIDLQELLCRLTGNAPCFSHGESFCQTKENLMSGSFLLSGFEVIADELLRMIVSYQEGTNLQKELQIFMQHVPEERRREQIDAFVAKSQAMWKKIQHNYREYRLVGCTAEAALKGGKVSYVHIKAELVLIRLLAFCRYAMTGSLSASDWCEAIQMTYRFCVHSRKASADFHHMADTLFSREDMWECFLQ